MTEPRGPFQPGHVSDGDRYEISRGHPLYVAPAGSRHGSEHAVGVLPLATDPAVREAGIDVGYALDDHTLRAPDIAVGNVPNTPGWVKGAPALAVEYADRGTNEEDLQAKIVELLAAGTLLVWVLRLIGPRRVEVYSAGAAPKTVGSGGMLEADGILSRPLPVDALFDRDRANEVTLENLLMQQGYASIDDVQTRSVRATLRATLDSMCRSWQLPVDESRRAWLDSADADALQRVLEHLIEHRAWP